MTRESAFPARPGTGAAGAPVRVLHVGHGRIFGGIETLLVTFARFRHLCPAMQPEFAVCFEGRLTEYMRHAGAAVHVLGGARASRPLTVRRARAALRKLLSGATFDVVICHAVWPHAVFAPVAHSAGVPVVFWQHDRLSGRHWTERWARRHRPLLAVSNSQFSAATLGRVFPGVPQHVVRCPVPSPGRETSPSYRTAVRAEFGTPDDAVVVVQVSRMEPWKGHLNLLRALGDVRDRPDWVCWIVGAAQRPAESAYEHEVRRAAHALGVADRVRFCGQRADVPRLLRAADIFCQPNSGAEPFGIVFIEALHAGLPVVTTALGGALEIVDESCGVLVPPGDPGALSAAIRRLVADAPRRRSLGAAGPARAGQLCDPRARMAQLARLLSTTAHKGPEATCT